GRAPRSSRCRVRRSEPGHHWTQGYTTTLHDYNIIVVEIRHPLAARAQEGVVSSRSHRRPANNRAEFSHGELSRSHSGASIANAARALGDVVRPRGSPWTPPIRSTDAHYPPRT